MEIRIIKISKFILLTIKLLKIFFNSKFKFNKFFKNQLKRTLFKEVSSS